MALFGCSHYRASLHCIALDTVLACYPLIWNDLRITSGYSHQKRLQIATFLYIAHACTTPTLLQIWMHALQEAMPRLFCHSSDCRRRLLVLRGVARDVWSDQHSFSACLHTPKYIPLLSALHVPRIHRQLRFVGAQPSWGPRADSFSTKKGVLMQAPECATLSVFRARTNYPVGVCSLPRYYTTAAFFLGTSKQEMMFERLAVLYKQSQARRGEERGKNNEVKKRLHFATIGVGVYQNFRVTFICILSDVGAYGCNLVRVLDGVPGLIHGTDECTRLIQRISQDVFIRIKQTLCCTCFSASPSMWVVLVVQIGCCPVRWTHGLPSR